VSLQLRGDVQRRRDEYMFRSRQSIIGRLICDMSVENEETLVALHAKG